MTDHTLYHRTIVLLRVPLIARLLSKYTSHPIPLHFQIKILTDISNTFVIGRTGLFLACESSSHQSNTTISSYFDLKKEPKNDFCSVLIMFLSFITRKGGESQMKIYYYHNINGRRQKRSTKRTSSD